MGPEKKEKYIPKLKEEDGRTAVLGRVCWSGSPVVTPPDGGQWLEGDGKAWLGGGVKKLESQGCEAVQTGSWPPSSILLRRKGEETLRDSKCNKTVSMCNHLKRVRLTSTVW